jgi:hypothetical protein
MSQRAADERENRRGLTLGLTLAEVLLLLLFLVLLALSWRMMAMERDQRMAVAILQRENARLQRANADLTSGLHGLRAINNDLEKLKTANAAIAAATEIDPKDPAELLRRAVAIVKRLTIAASPEHAGAASAMLSPSEKLDMLERAAEVAQQLNPHDPAEALARAAEILARLGADARPDEVMPIDQIVSLSRERDQAISERNNLMRTGNGLTYPSCWRTAEGKTEFIFDVTFQDTGIIVRNATPSRASDPAMQLVAGVPRNDLINESVFKSETLELFNYSKGQNCRFYAIIRDSTGATNKARYKELVALVENHFYTLRRSAPWTDLAVGGPFQPAKP